MEPEEVMTLRELDVWEEGGIRRQTRKHEEGHVALKVTLHDLYWDLLQPDL